MLGLPNASPNFLMDMISGSGAGMGGSMSAATVPGVGTVRQTGYPGTGPKPGAAPTGPATTTPGPDFVNTAQDNPDMRYALDKMKGRFEGDGGASTAIDLAAGKTRDWGEGERRAAMGRRASRGAVGSGVESFDDRRITGEVGSRIAGQAQDIALNREQQKDQILNNIANTSSAAAGVNGAAQDRALNQWRTVQENQRAQEAAQQAQLAAIMSLMNSVGSTAKPVIPGTASPSAPGSIGPGNKTAFAVRPVAGPGR